MSDYLKDPRLPLLLEITRQLPSVEQMPIDELDGILEPLNDADRWMLSKNEGGIYTAMYGVEGEGGSIVYHNATSEDISEAIERARAKATNVSQTSKPEFPSKSNTSPVGPRD